MRKARTSCRRSADVKERKRRVLDIVNDFNELALCELFVKGNEISFAAVRLHVVLRKKRVADLANRQRCLNELPDASINGIKPVVDAVFEVEDCRFVPKICGGLLF
jgi:hypothetical protein